MSKTPDRTLVAGRNPASKWWPNHNPNVIVIRSGAWAHLDDDASTVAPLTAATLQGRQ